MRGEHTVCAVIFMVTMCGGPHDGRVFMYPEPLPRVLCFQACIDGRWRTVEYERDGSSLNYVLLERPAEAEEPDCAAAPVGG